MRRIVENKNSQLLKELKTGFSRLTASFESMLLPFTLRSYKEGLLVRIQEVEIQGIEQDYEEFEVNLNQLIRAASTFVRTYTSPNFILENVGENNNFTDFVSRKIHEAVDLYDGVVTKAQQENQSIFKLFQKTYLAYTMLARVLNTAIHYYNQRHLQNQLPELQNIPDPQYFDIGEDISAFIRGFIEDLNKLNSQERIQEMLNTGDASIAIGTEIQFLDSDGEKT